MTTLYAQPYNIDATGFYFDSAEDYEAKAKDNFDRYGQFVEEYEIQFIDGEQIDCELAKAIGLSQCNFATFLDCVDRWEDHEKIRFTIANGECGYSLDPADVDIDGLDIDIYEEDTMRDLAMRFVNDGLFGEIPEQLRIYIDYGAIGRDLSVDYSETEIAGTRLIYRCA